MGHHGAKEHRGIEPFRNLVVTTLYTPKGYKGPWGFGKDPRTPGSRKDPFGTFFNGWISKWNWWFIPLSGTLFILFWGTRTTSKFIICSLYNNFQPITTKDTNSSNQNPFYKERSDAITEQQSNAQSTHNRLFTQLNYPMLTRLCLILYFQLIENTIWFSDKGTSLSRHIILTLAICLSTAAIAMATGCVSIVLQLNVSRPYDRYISKDLDFGCDAVYSNLNPTTSTKSIYNKCYTTMVSKASFILHSPRSGFSHPQDSTRINHCYDSANSGCFAERGRSDRRCTQHAKIPSALTSDTYE
jgi:hypothetical protein